MPNQRTESNRDAWTLARSALSSIILLIILRSCRARDVVVCSTVESFGYAAQSSLFEFEGHKLRMSWFQSAKLIPLPNSGGCDVVRLPSHEVTGYILRGVDLQIHTVRFQLRRLFQLVAHAHVISPDMLLGKTVAVFQATEMHVFLHQAIAVLSLSYREVTRQELLDGGLEPNERAVTLVLCDDDVEVESLYTLNFVDAKAVPVSGSSMELDPDEVLFTTEDLHRWGRTFSFVMVTTREWAQDPVNMRLLQYFTAVAEVYDAQYALQPFNSSSPEISYLMKLWVGLLGYDVMGDQTPGVSPAMKKFMANNLAENLPTFYFLPSGDRFWEDHVSQMVDKTILQELVRNSELFYTNGWSARKMDEADFDRHLNLRVFEGLEDMIRNVTASFDWAPGQSPGVQQLPPELGAWNNWPAPSQANYCSGVVELSSHVSGSFSDGHLGRGQYAPNSTCDWVILPPPTSGDNSTASDPLLVEFPLLFMDPMSQRDTVQVVDPRAPHRLLAHFRGEMVGGAVRHSGPLAVKFRSNIVRRLNTMEMEMGLKAEYSYLGCSSDPRGCGEGLCGDDGVCVCPEGRSGVDCGLEHCLGTNVYTPQPGESLVMRSNAGASYAPVSDCRWEVHPPADCAACVVDVVFLSLQTELGHDAVQVATAPSAEAFWWEHPPNDTKVYSRTNLDSSGLRVRGLPGMAVFVRLLSDEVVEEAGFVATARVIDTSKHIAGASTSNCYDAEGDQACSGQGECVPGKAEGQFGMCMCKAGFFGRTCLDSVCDRVNIAPTLPRWTMGGESGSRLIAPNSECEWALAPAPLTSKGGEKTLSASSVHVYVLRWDFGGTRNNQLTLKGDAHEVKLQTDRCVSGQECDLSHQCSFRQGSVVGPCVWTRWFSGLEMPPRFTINLRTGMNVDAPNVTLAVQVSYMTPSGHAVVAREEAAPSSLVCNPKLGQTISLVFDHDAMDCLPPPITAPPPSFTEKHYSMLLVQVLVPVVAVLLLAAVVLGHRNRSLSHDLTDLRIKSMRLDPGGFAMDLDSPLVKVTKYLSKVVKKQSCLSRWLLPRDDLAEQAVQLNALLQDSQNVHRPRLDMDLLEAECGRDIVDFLLASTCARSFSAMNALTEVVVQTRADQASLDSESVSTSNPRASVDSSTPSYYSAKILEEECGVFESAGRSYNVDMRLAYTRQLKGTLCYVAMKVLEEWGLVRFLKIKRSRMVSYLLEVESGYLDRPYHNVYHAADVTNRLATMFTKSGLVEHLKKTYSGRVQLLGVVLAAAVHDYGHPGTNNAFAVKTGQLYAKIYNDQAVYENSALYRALSFTDKPELDFTAGFSQDHKRLLRVTIIDMVLSTDMSRHFDIVTMVQTKVDSIMEKPVSRQVSGFVESRHGSNNRREAEANIDIEPGLCLSDVSPDQMHLIFQFALKVADIGHCMLPLDQHKFWVGNLETEFFKQGDLEKEAGLPISPLMDRNKPGPAYGSNQVGFFSVIVSPTISLWQKLFPGSADELYEQTLSNALFWKSNSQMDN